MPDPIKKKQSKYRTSSYTPEKTVKVFGTEFSVPSIESNKAKRDYIKKLKKGQKNEIYYAKNDDQKEKVKIKYKKEIRKARGGKSWLGEKISDTKEFIEDVNILKSQLSNTGLGQVVGAVTGLNSSIKSSNPEKIIKSSVNAFNTVRGLDKKQNNTAPKDDSCACG